MSYDPKDPKGYDPKDPKGSDEDVTKIGALADGYATSAANSTEVDEASTGYVGVANGDNRNNSSEVDVDLKVDVDAKNGDNRDNEYDWNYDSKTITDTDTKTVTETHSDYDWSYDSKSYSDNDTKTVTDTDTKTITDNDTDIKQISDNDTDIKQITDNDTDIKTITDTETKTVTDSFNHTDTDFAVLEDVKDFGNLGIAGGDLTFNLGDDFSFTLDVNNILNGSLGGDGNDTGFSIVQANHLADQDIAYDFKMNNAGAHNELSANGGEAYAQEGVDLDGKGGWDLKVDDDLTGSSAADADAILANSGFHMEVVQGANMLSNAVDASVIGGNSTVDTAGEDS